MNMRKINFTETVLRDANQSLIATRLPYDKFESILETMDKAGYYSAEVWGGATFDVCLRYLQEDPWERLRKIRAKMPNTKLQMLLRGQNILGYKHYPDDVVRKFVEYSVKNGIDIIRIFDALNDVRNLEVAIDETVKQGAHASGTICFTTSPVHTLEKNVAMVKDLQKMGVKSIAIKDMAGIMGPKDAYDLVSAIKDAVPELPVVVHTHCTTGLAFMTYLKAVEAGADVIDTAIETIVKPTVQAMADEGTPFTGILYAGLIATADGPKVIEFNARFGDPETEVVLPKLTSDLGAGINAILNGETPEFTWDEDNATLGVVIASEGYPTNVVKGAAIPEITVDDDSHVYYAGVARGEHGLVANSGRVLLVESSAADIKAAQDKVYAIIDKLDTKGMFYRHDIGFKALNA